METTEIMLANPNGSQTVIDRAREMLMARQREAVADIEAATALLATDGIKGHTKKAFDATVKLFTDAGKKLSADICAATGADKIFVQLKASETAVKDAVKAYQAAWDEAKAAITPPAPKHTYVFQFECDDDGLKKIVTAVTKECGTQFRWAAAQSDKAGRQIEKWFAENI